MLLQLIKLSFKSEILIVQFLGLQVFWARFVPVNLILKVLDMLLRVESDLTHTLLGMQGIFKKLVWLWGLLI